LLSLVTDRIESGTQRTANAEPSSHCFDGFDYYPPHPFSRNSAAFANFIVRVAIKTHFDYSPRTLRGVMESGLCAVNILFLF